MKPIILVMSLLLVSGCAVSPATSARPSDGADAPQTPPRRTSMSFADLFQLAKGRAWADEEVAGFQALDQEGKNRVVRELAAEAGGIRTEDQVGTDGVVYTAFWRE